MPKVLIANRGEIAVRIIRACKELGLETVAIYSSIDQDSLHVRLADEAVCIGGAPARESYLNINNIISAALATGATLIHPGYGFLSENAQFAEIVEGCQITFIGPSPQAMRSMGDKATAKKIAKSVHVPIISGSEGTIQSLTEGLAIARKIGYPVMLKACNGGGGRGISIIRTEHEFKAIYQKTTLEAEASFGSGQLYIEKYIEAPRHIEVQILADRAGNVYYLGERDCSLQRRNQKIIEETPSPLIDAPLRRRMGQAAVRIAKAVKFLGAGTIEFLIDQKHNFYFIEMNTRIQVEHPVTEAVTGIDLIKEQLNIALSGSVSFKRSDLVMRGHAIECRINAEDAENNFMPCAGTIERLTLPGGMGIRIDTHIFSGYTIPPHYDSLLAKLVAYAPTRAEAIEKMKVALHEFSIKGIKTNIEFLECIMGNESFNLGQYDTDFITRLLESAK